MGQGELGWIRLVLDAAYCWGQALPWQVYKLHGQERAGGETEAQRKEATGLGSPSSSVAELELALRC